jgi:hypothetical protein
MYSKIRIIVALLITVALGITGMGYAFQYAKFLTISDIEKVTGLKGVTPMPKSEEADGDLNFASKDGQLILSVTFLPSSAYAGYRSSKEGYKSAISGVGEEGFIGPAGSAPPFILVFKKAGYAVMLNTVSEDNTVLLPIEQLTALAKVIASRM